MPLLNLVLCLAESDLRLVCSWNVFSEYMRLRLRKRKVHPCTGTEALYRPYGP